jgi:aminoglycoside phosphotransferase (APT) family kinase protein
VISESLPDLEDLTTSLAPTGLSRVAGRPTVLHREPNPYGDDRSEIVTCRLPDGRELQLFCKHGDDAPQSDSAYEARVYQEVLEPLQLSTPRCYGAETHPSTGRTLLLLEYVEGLNEEDRELDDEDALRIAARWLGRFHAACEKQFPRPPAFLKRCDARYYAERARNALTVRNTTQAHPWLAMVVDALEDLLEPLMDARATIVHGDFHDDNVVVRDGRAMVIDWEEAGVDLGEADLVYLVRGWSDDLVDACMREYTCARWPAGAPRDLELAVDAAWLCLYLGEITAQGWDADARRRRAPDRVEAVAQRLGLLHGKGRRG